MSIPIDSPQVRFRQDRVWLWLDVTMILVSVVLVFGVWSVSSARQGREEASVLASAEGMQKNLTRVLSENLRQVLDRTKMYRELADAWLGGDSGARARLIDLLSTDRVFQRAFVFDRRGSVVYASPGAQLDDAVLSEVGARLEADAPASRQDADVRAVSSVAGTDRQTPLVLLRRDKAGRSSGAVVLLLDLDHLLRVYSQVDIGAKGAIHVVADDGAELARAARGGLVAVGSERRSVELPLTPDSTRTAGEQASGRDAPISRRDGLRLSTTARLPGYPLSVSVSQDVDELLDSLQDRNRKDRNILVAITLVAGLLTFASMTLVARQRRSAKTLRQSELEKQQLIEQLRAEKVRASELASHDHLTGLFNRRMFMEVAGSNLAQARRNRKHAAVLFLDLDRFKPVNDTLGHKVGDCLLQQVAMRLRDLVRESDVLARVGGDEFVILLSGLNEESDVEHVASRVVDTVACPFVDLDGHEVRIATSVGIALCPRDGQELDRLIRHADDAMYRSKRKGPGRYTYFDPALNITNAEDFELEQRLPAAIDAGELVLHYQPKVELREFRISGFEALVRWQHPEYGLIFPGRFLPLAERAGLMARLDAAVIVMACRQLSQWLVDHAQVVPVAINLSPDRIEDTRVVDQILHNLSQFGVPPALLHVEITENTLVGSYERLSTTLTRLAEAGVHIALDDFGNGYAGLNQVRELPIDSIKIDRSFIHDILNSHDDKIIVESSIILAHKLGLRVIAEGVETREQLAHLKTAGCDEVQGYLFSRPVPAEAADALLRDPVLKP